MEALIHNHYSSYPNQTIIRNEGHCTQCDERIVSLYEDLIEGCTCGNLSVSGGHGFVRHVVLDPTCYKNYTIVMTEK